MWPSRSGRRAMIPAAKRRDGRCADVAVDDGHRPLAVDVDVVARRVEVPAPHARRPAADLGELQALGPGEPLHVRGRRPDAERLDHALAHLLQLVVAGRRVDAVGGDELRRDPAGAHRLEHVRVVVRDEVVRDRAVDGDRVVEALVALDELLDGDRRRPGRRTLPSAASSSSASSTRSCPTRRRPSRGLRMSGKPTASRERPDLARRCRRAGRRRGRDAGLAQRLLHRRLVAAQEGRAHRGARDRARLAHLRGGHDVGLDRRLQPVDPELVLDPAHGVDQRALVDDGGDLLVVGQPAPAGRRRASPPGARRCR